MTDEKSFHVRLDRYPFDHQTRLIFADWLQERDDPRAEGYRALGALRRVPVKTRVSVAAWVNPGFMRARKREERPWSFDALTTEPWRDWDVAWASLPHRWLDAVATGLEVMDRGRWVTGPTRRVIEDAVARAFALLPEPVRGRYLAGKWAVLDGPHFRRAMGGPKPARR